MITRLLCGLVLAFLLFWLLPMAQAEESHLSLEPSASVDVISPIFTSRKEDRVFSIEPRSAELSLWAAPDDYFEGLIAVAAHKESGSYLFDLHEAYLASEKIIPSTRIKAGKFILGVGRLNQMHQHEWAFTMAPKSHQSFFSDENVADSGVEIAYTLPSRNFLELLAGITRNYCYGHCHQDGDKPPRPLYYFRSLLFFNAPSVWEMELGLNYLNRVDSSKVQVHLAGLDWVFRKFRQDYELFRLEAEVFYQDENSDSINRVSQLGAYHFAEYRLAHQWFAGLRLDGFTQLNLKFPLSGERRENFDYAISPQVSWKPSDAATIRLSYVYDAETMQATSANQEHLGFLQFILSFGSHAGHKH